MKNLLGIFLASLLTACATPPQWLANHFDAGDVCQTREFASDGTRLKPQGYQQPYGCGGGRQTTGVVRDTQGRVQAIITTR